MDSDDKKLSLLSIIITRNFLKQPYIVNAPKQKVVDLLPNHITQRGFVKDVELQAAKIVANISIFSTRKSDK